MTSKCIGVLNSLSLLLIIAGCSNVGGDVFAGRNALQTGRPKDAIGYLVRAADADPNYKLPYRIRPGVLVYLGRAYLETGKTQKLDKRWKERSSSIKTIRLYICTLGSRCQRPASANAVVKKSKMGFEPSTTRSHISQRIVSMGSSGIPEWKFAMIFEHR